jgi:hypothetical protein
MKVKTTSFIQYKLINISQFLTGCKNNCALLVREQNDSHLDWDLSPGQSSIENDTYGIKKLLLKTQVS